MATIAINVGLCCFGADVLLANSNKSRLPITNLYMDISYKAVSNAMSALYNFPVGKCVLGGISILVAKDVGFIDYAAKKIEVSCSESLEVYGFNFECCDYSSFINQFGNAANFTGESSPLVNNSSAFKEIDNV